ncbi:MAG: sulfatase [Phycisphaerae bacterium]
MGRLGDTRREFLRAMGLGAAAASMPRGLARAAPSKRPFEKARGRPNILFIMSDDHAAPAMSCYGSRINKTPNLDRIATEGMRLTNCFCTNSICTPSRAVIMTGKHSHKNGVFTLADRLDERQQTFARLLQKAGYHTGVVGKWHLKTPPSAFGFDRWEVLPGQGAYFDPVMLRSEGRRKHTGYVTDIITDLALDFLKGRPKDKPFCLLYHHKAPHDNFEYDEKHATLYEGVDIPEPENLHDDYANRAQAIKRVTQKIGMKHTAYTKQTRDLPPGERKRRQYQIYIKSYLRCVASIDDNVGRVLDYLDKQGLTKDTVVVYTSDQGFFLGEHGMYDKRFMYEESLRVPLIVRYPREIKAGGVSDALAQNVDFAETFLDYAGVAIPKDMQGRSLRGVLAGKAPDDWRNSVYYRYWMHGAHFDVAAHYGVRTKRYKLIFYYGLPLGKRGCTKKAYEPEWELFDLENDPREMKNVYADPACADVVTKLKAELLRLKRELGDEDEAYPELVKVRRQAW